MRQFLQRNGLSNIDKSQALITFAFRRNIDNALILGYICIKYQWYFDLEIFYRNQAIFPYLIYSKKQTKQLNIVKPDK